MVSGGLRRLFAQRSALTKRKVTYLYSLLSGVLVVALVWSYLTDIGAVQLDPDESDWIGSSQVFEAFFTGDFTSPHFAESYWTLTQPPLVRYVIGFGRRLGGFSQTELNRTWDWTYDFQGNVDRGAMPSPALLWWSRLPMALLAIVSILGIWLMLRGSFGQHVGVVWLLLIVLSSYLRTHLRRAMAESLLLLSVTLILLVCYAVLHRLNQNNVLAKRTLFGWMSILGSIIGLSGAVKLNGLAGISVALGMAVLVAVKQRVTIIQRIRLGLMLCVLALCATLVTFVAVNPFLWSHPTARIQAMIDQRVLEMNQQKKLFADSVIPNVTQTVIIVPGRIFKNYATLNGAIGSLLNVLFCFGGIAFLIRRIRMRWRSRMVDPAATAILLCSMIAVPSLFTPLDWGRYYFLPIVFSTLCIAIGMGEALRLLHDRLHDKTVNMARPAT